MKRIYERVARKRMRSSQRSTNTGNMPFVPLSLHKQHMCPNPLFAICNPDTKMHAPQEKQQKREKQ